MERAAVLVPQYLNISLRNADTSNLNVRDIDRDARVFFLPEKWVGLWREVARERTQAFLEGVDNWLEDHTRPDESGPVERSQSTAMAILASRAYPGEAARTLADSKGRDDEFHQFLCGTASRCER